MYKQHFLIHLTRITDEDHSNWFQQRVCQISTVNEKIFLKDFYTFNSHDILLKLIDIHCSAFQAFNRISFICLH